MSNPEEVRFVQGALNQVFKAGLKVDGLWGEETAAKLKEFQRKFNLDADGVPGSKTMAELKRQFTLSYVGTSGAP